LGKIEENGVLKGEDADFGEKSKRNRLEIEIWERGKNENGVFGRSK
jgi:hypothetical protein